MGLDSPALHATESAGPICREPNQICMTDDV